MMWSPLIWDPDAPPAALVDAKAILNLWTGDVSKLAYNITLKVTRDLEHVCWYDISNKRFGIVRCTRLQIQALWYCGIVRES